MTRTFNYLAPLAAVGMAFPAAAATQAEVDGARNECRQHKLMVQDKGSFARDEDKRAWESACGLATRLMDEMSGKAPTAVAAAPPAEPAAEQAAFEAPVAATPSAYSYFLHENMKKQAASGSSTTAALAPSPVAAAEPAPAVSEPAPPAVEAVGPEAPEDETEGDYVPPGP